MPYCQKCGSEVTEEMKHCPKCGASLKLGAISRETYEKYEKEEKTERHEKEEKTEKHEKEEVSRFWILIFGIIIVIIGATSLITALLDLPSSWRGAVLLVSIGIVIILFAIYGAMKSSRRNPRP